MRSPRGNVDDLAGSARKHVRADGARAQQSLRQVDIHDELEFVVGYGGGLVARQRHQGFANGVSQCIDQHVDAPEGGQHGINGAPDLVRLRYVGNDRNHTSSGCCGDVCCRAFNVLRRQRIERDIRAGLGKHLGYAFAYAASGSGDKNNFSRDIKFSRHHDVFSGCVAVCGLLAGTAHYRSRNAQDATGGIGSGSAQPTGTSRSLEP